MKPVCVTFPNYYYRTGKLLGEHSQTWFVCKKSTILFGTPSDVDRRSRRTKRSIHPSPVLFSESLSAYGSYRLARGQGSTRTSGRSASLVFRLGRLFTSCRLPIHRKCAQFCQPWLFCFRLFCLVGRLIHPGDVIKLFIPALLRLGRLCRSRRRSLRRRTCHRNRSIRRRTTFLNAFSILFSFVSVSIQRNSILCRGGGLFITLCTRRVF